MGLATIDPHSCKVQTKLYKIPKFGVNTLKSKQDVKKCQNLQRNVWPVAVSDSVRMLYISLLILTFLKSLYLSQN